MLKYCLSVALFSATFGFAQLSISPASLPDAAPGQLYYQELHATGGTAPYRWGLRGRLPSGISFDAPTGTLTGPPASPVDYTFTVVVTDGSNRTVGRRYTLHVGAGTTITIAWTRNPTVADGGIVGEVEVSNPGNEAFDLTFIAVAVNETGRATALGYQKFTFGPGKQRIPFGTTLPHGTYVVHADAIGEIARTQTIRRARLQTSPLNVP